MKKVVLLGDSIRLMGYGTQVPQLLGEEYSVWQPRENCMFAVYTLRMLYDCKEDIAGADVIHWNNGLWDLCHNFDDGTFTDPESYVAVMKRIARILLSCGKRVIFATTTPVTDRHERIRNDEIVQYNEAVVPVLREMGVIINDLHALVAQDVDAYIRKDDNIHLTDAGIAVCAKQVVNMIKEAEKDLQAR